MSIFGQPGTRTSTYLSNNAIKKTKTLNQDKKVRNAKCDLTHTRPTPKAMHFASPFLNVEVIDKSCNVITFYLNFIIR